MSSWYQTMTFSFRKLLKGIFVHFKSRAIVHGRDNNSLLTNNWELQKIKKSFDISRTPYRLLMTERTGVPENNEQDMSKMLADAMDMLYADNPELALKVSEELTAAAAGEENILLVGTDGQYSITILHVDPSFINGHRGIVLLPSSSSVSILAAVSRDFIEENIVRCESIEEISTKAEADSLWDAFMGALLKEAVELHEKNPNVL